MQPSGDTVRGAFRPEAIAATDALVINQRLLSNNKAECVNTPAAERPVPCVAPREPNHTSIEIDIVTANLSDLGSSATGFAKGDEPRCERKQKSAGAFVADPLHFGIGEKACRLGAISLKGRAEKVDCRCDAEVIELTQQ